MKLAQPTRQHQPTRPAWHVALFCWLALYWPAAEADQHNLEYRVKAAFLYNFTRFVEWPPNAYASADAPLEICIIGNDPFGRQLDQTVEGKSSNGHPLTIRRIRQSSDADSCKLLFISTSEQPRARDVIYALRGKPVLTVGDNSDFISHGAIVSFLLVDGKVRFTINQGAAEQARLTISSKLLGVAHSVVREPLQ